MADVYESDSPLIFLDLGYLREDLNEIGNNEIVFDETLFLNGLLQFVKYRDMLDQVLQKFSSSVMLNSEEIYRNLNPIFTENKKIYLQENINLLKEISFNLRNTFLINNLYNKSGILLIGSLDASNLNACIATKDKLVWKNGNKNTYTSSTYEMLEMYLRDILMSI